MAHGALGIDFGTSNTVLAVAAGAAGAELVPVEDGRTAIPSAVFFDFETHERRYGQNAITAYIDGYEGRFMRALKSILGSELMGERTAIRGVRYSYSDIIAHFLGELRERAERHMGRAFDSVVAGRPVFFVDDDPAADRTAQETLETIYQRAGFARVLFEYEPIAAALDYERRVRGEEIVLIADLGGGTADFSLVRVSPDGARKAERGEDILSTAGVHVGGTDLDRLVSIARVMPLLGLGAELKRDFARGTLTVPRHIFHALSTWHEIHRLYTHATLEEVRDYRRRALDETPFARLETVLEERLGHRLIFAIEAAKIALTDAQTGVIDLGEIETGLTEALERSDFEALLVAPAERILGALEAAIASAGVAREDIAAVFFTGGTAAIPAIRRALLSALPEAAVVDGDRFGSVGAGLALAARRRFGAALSTENQPA